MAYKNKRKNARHQAEIRKANSLTKHKRKLSVYERKHPGESYEEQMKRIADQMGLR